VAIERGLNDPALDTAPASVHQPHLAPARRRGGIDVVGHHLRSVARRERVQIELALDRNANRLISHQTKREPRKHEDTKKNGLGFLRGFVASWLHRFY
jgi:hypothetical protein